MLCWSLNMLAQGLPTAWRQEMNKWIITPELRLRRSGLDFPEADCITSSYISQSGGLDPDQGHTAAPHISVALVRSDHRSGGPENSSNSQDPNLDRDPCSYESPIPWFRGHRHLVQMHEPDPDLRVADPPPSRARERIGASNSHKLCDNSSPESKRIRQNPLCFISFTTFS